MDGHGYHTTYIANKKVHDLNYVDGDDCAAALPVRYLHLNKSGDARLSKRPFLKNIQAAFRIKDKEAVVAEAAPAAAASAAAASGSGKRKWQAEAAAEAAAAAEAEAAADGGSRIDIDAVLDPEKLLPASPLGSALGLVLALAVPED